MMNSDLTLMFFDNPLGSIANICSVQLFKLLL